MWQILLYNITVGGLALLGQRRYGHVVARRLPGPSWLYLFRARKAKRRERRAEPSNQTHVQDSLELEDLTDDIRLPF